MEFTAVSHWHKVHGCYCFVILNFYSYGHEPNDVLEGFGFVVFNFGFEWHRAKQHIGDALQWMR